jgi:hypothetical protein
MSDARRAIIEFPRHDSSYALEKLDTAVLDLETYPSCLRTRLREAVQSLNAVRFSRQSSSEDVGGDAAFNPPKAPNM